MSQNAEDPPTTEPGERDGLPVVQPVEVIVGCPVCREPMQLIDVDEITVDVCSEHGIWLDLGEDEALVRRMKRYPRPGNFHRMARATRRGYAKGYMETGFLFSSESSRRLQKRLANNRKARLRASMAARHPKPDPLSEQPLLCPVCGEVMQKQIREDRYGETSDIVVDICSEHGVWLACTSRGIVRASHENFSDHWRYEPSEGLRTLTGCFWRVRLAEIKARTGANPERVGDEHLRRARSGGPPETARAREKCRLDTGELDVLVDRAEDESRRAAARRVRQAYERGLQEGREAGWAE